MPLAKTSHKGQVVIPKAIRRAIGLNPGQPVVMKVVGDHAEIRPAAADVVAEFCGIAAEGESLTSALLEEHRKEVARGR